MGVGSGVGVGVAVGGGVGVGVGVVVGRMGVRVGVGVGSGAPIWQPLMIQIRLRQSAKAMWRRLKIVIVRLAPTNLTRAVEARAHKTAGLGLGGDLAGGLCFAQGLQ